MNRDHSMGTKSNWESAAAWVTALARIFHESVSRDREGGLATWQPQGLESEAHLNSTSQDLRPEDARKEGHIHGLSSRFMNYPG